jgi:acetamidase/formamidase
LEWPYPIDKARNEATFQAKDSNFTVKIPLHPFLGCVGVAPGGGEARGSIVPAEFGGNMDAPEASAGNGDGEIDGTAIEISMKVRLRVKLIKNQKIDWPRFENSDYIMSVGICYGLSEMNSYELLSKVAEIHLDEMVDPNYVVVAKINKKFLPPPLAR